MRCPLNSWLPVVAFVAFSLAGCASLGTAFAPKVTAGHADAARAFTAGHLYVGVSGFYSPSVIYRYPLDANGLPAKQPDGKLTIFARNPGSIAIGPDGDLYVSSAGSPNGCRYGKCYVEVFAPGASGRADPIRVLYVPQKPLYVAVDQQGYLDVSTLNGGVVTLVYAPNAKGHDRPTNRIATHGVNALAASHGVVYVQTLPPGEGIEALDEHAKSKGPLFYSYGQNFSADGIATEGEHLYAQFFWQQGYSYLLATAVWRIGAPGQQIRTIVGTGCRVSRNGGALGYGLAAYKKYIYEGCIDVPSANGEVLVYDNTGNGKERPIRKVPGGDAGVAIGP